MECQIAAITDAEFAKGRRITAKLNGKSSKLSN